MGQTRAQKIEKERREEAFQSLQMLNNLLASDFVITILKSGTLPIHIVAESNEKAFTASAWTVHQALQNIVEKVQR